MYPVEKATQLADRVYQVWIHAPHVARHAAPGQFVVIRIDEQGERIPLTISGVVGDSIRLIYMAVGKTTSQLARCRSGEPIRDIVGPLGRPTDIRRYGTCVLVGGGVGIASLPVIARALRAAGNRVVGVLGARTASLLILEEEMRDSCDEVFITTDDGSRDRKGFAADVLRDLVASRPIDAVWVIGPAIMMKVTSGVTKEKGILTFVSLNPVMVDGTGMCGSCRVRVGGQVKFACVDGPEFDAHQVDFDSLMQRLRMYQDEEKQAMDQFQAHPCGCHGGT
ncbi:MAG: sulfide/dihydroorotate dehydrogenase-like FAD/NAD-binding protein [Methanomicrobiales archaeon]|nr:sulfide/dihydroorotate dehydrogenase-like FAD/NAD-binding protein [Methanomicrobiales archaeon]